MLEVLQDSSLGKLSKIRHGFFTRVGGVSSGYYASLNCAYPSNDDPGNVEKNRQIVTGYFGYDVESLVTVKNIHSNKVIIVNHAWEESNKPAADALVTSLPQIILGSDSADCPIILLADDKSNVIALAHAGWRGAKNGIIEATVEKMIFLGAKSYNITAAISPCIAQNSYEVNAEFHKEFLNKNLSNQCYFKDSNKQNHFLFDLLGYVKDHLILLGLKFVSSEVAFDTYSDASRFYSCRRSLHMNEPYFGGQLSCILRK